MRCNHSFTLEPNQWEVYQLCTYFNKIIVQLQLNALKVLNTEFSKKCLCKYSNISCYSSIISIRQNYNFDMSAMIWHEIVCWFLKIYQDLKRFAAQEHRIVFVLIFRCAKQFYVPTFKNNQKWVKNQKSTDKNSSFDCLIQADIYLSDIYLAVLITLLTFSGSKSDVELTWQ